MVAAMHGARIVRVHDVADTVDALKVWQAVARIGEADRQAAGIALQDIKI
jgi:dihydropteroate synthase